MLISETGAPNLPLDFDTQSVHQSFRASFDVEGVNVQPSRLNT